MAAPEPVPFVLITNEDSVAEDAILSGNDFIQQCLIWIGFNTAAQRNTIMADAFDSIRDVTVLSEDDISSLDRSFASRVVADGRILFGLRRTKYLKGFTHFIQDFARVNELPVIQKLSKTTFRDALDIALQRAEVRSNMIRNSKLAAETANPGKLDSENKWKQWEERFINFLSVQLGTNGIPLSYIIRENDIPDTTTTFSNFISRTIACAPLNGEYYLADRRTVFQLIVIATTGCASADWIKSTLRYSDGRRTWKKLTDHFAGEGSVSKALAEAEHLFETLHYKNERALTFETFLTKTQKMFNIFEKHGEPMGNDAQVRFLFKHVQHPELEAPIEALRVLQSGGDVITYTRAANHLSTHVSNMKDRFQSNRNRLRRQVAGVSTDGKEDAPSIYNSDGSIITGRIDGWNKLSVADRKLVYEERKRLGVKGPNKKELSYNPAREKQLADTNKKQKRTIKALKKQLSKNDNTDSADSDNSDDDKEIDAGDAFGGKQSKKKKK